MCCRAKRVEANAGSRRNGRHERIALARHPWFSTLFRSIPLESLIRDGVPARQEAGGSSQMNRICPSQLIPELLFLSLFALLMARLLLVEPIAGLADNNDYHRVMSEVGLRYLTDDREERYYKNINRYYGIGPRRDDGYFTSESLLVWIALRAERLLTRHRLFSLTSAGAVHAIAFLSALGLMTVSTRRWPRLPRLLLYFLLIFMFGDVGYIAYFNSLYSEPASLIFLSTTIGFALLLARGEGSSARRWALGIGYYLAASLFVIAKPQNALGGMPLAALGYVLAEPQDETRTGGSNPRLLAGLSLLFAAFSIWLALAGQPEHLKRANLYNAVFFDLLAHSPTPEEDMRALGIHDPQYVGLIGKPVYAPPSSIIFLPEFERGFYEKIGYGRIVTFYVQRPRRFWNLISRISQSAYAIRPEGLGNFERGVGLFQRRTFSQWSRLREILFPRSPWLLVAVFLLSGGAAVAKFIWFDRDRRDRNLSALHVVLIVLAALQFLAAAIGEGEYEIVKHLLLFNALFDWLLAILALYGAGWISAKRASWQSGPH